MPPGRTAAAGELTLAQNTSWINCDHEKNRKTGIAALFRPQTTKSKAFEMTKRFVESKEAVTAEKDETTGQKMMCIQDFKEVADRKLPRVHRNYYNDGSTDQITVRENSTAFLKYRIRPRVLVDVSQCCPSIECLGRKVAFPVGIAPTVQFIAHPDAEVATSRACARKGINMAIGSLASNTVKDICGAGKSVDSNMTYAMQMYPFKNRVMAAKLIKEAEAQGCKAVFLTADSPTLGVRYREWKDDFRIPSEQGFPNIGWTVERLRAQSNDSVGQDTLDDSQNWARDIAWFKSQTKMEIWIKGVLTAEDTQKAVEMGCHGIIVSNHGGRQLDGVPATIDALPECVKAASGRLKVHIDGGIRTGSDIFKAIALGAECCWLGRPALWALAYDGEKGMDLMLQVLYDDFVRCMKLAGCQTIKDITKASLGVVRHDGPLARL
ncbi:(S)-2-hydroxy-acid oxidase [Coccidioides immitis RS]|uniref:FMN oxidoreductase cocF n=1 Tax=Coccidioides immitis (strain RS) TaxID=246410 RepID=COCF_COCIM|nr:(S)-2-hydroxy-acid oxidase [Coccidioides immitis RS]EAS32143.3 (S)-2-hydroxy-acid oxidase [Coccidioides immitis RS]